MENSKAGCDKRLTVFIVAYNLLVTMLKIVKLVFTVTSARIGFNGTREQPS
jgi:hypothetical protein